MTRRVSAETQENVREFLETRVGDETLDLRTFTFANRWTFTAVHRDGQRRRVLQGLHVPDPNVASPRVVAMALDEARRAGAALEVDRVR